MHIRIDTPAMRRKIPVGKAPVWRAIGGQRDGLKLGYRKGSKGGAWIAKAVGNKVRRETTLGPADDDGAQPGALTFKAAIAAALDWGRREKVRQTSESQHATFTVKGAVENYLDERKRRDNKSGNDARSKLGKHVLSDKELCQLPLDKLTAKELRAWAARKSTTLAPATLNRLQNDLRAALNVAIDGHARVLPVTTRGEVTAGLRAQRDAEQARRVVLADAEVRAIVAAAEEINDDFAALVLVLASTGCRFSQSAKIAVADLQPDARRILVPSSRKGRSTKVRPPIAVPVGDDVVARLKPLIAGRKSLEPLLERWISRQTGPCTWERIARGPWRAPSEMTRRWAATLRAAGLSGNIPPYALRHSSIVRALRAGVPVRIAAALHDTSSSMIEKHYAAYILDISEDIARRSVTHLLSRPVSRLTVA